MLGDAMGAAQRSSHRRPYGISLNDDLGDADDLLEAKDVVDIRTIVSQWQPHPKA